MAVDEALFESCVSGASAVPVLRVYFWSEPCCTVGYFQDAARAAAALGVPVARRSTGGGLVRHGSDLTFSLSLPKANPFVGSDVKESYLKVNAALIRGFRALHPEIDYSPCKDVPSGRASNERVCFESPVCSDLMLGGKKVVGASQRRREGAILHQSAVFLPDTTKKTIAALRKGFEEEWSAVFDESKLGAEEIERAVGIARERYGAPEWAAPTVQDARALFLESSFRR